MNPEKMLQISEQEKKSSEKFSEFEKIKTPQELLSYMAKNIKYGFIGRNNHKRYQWDDKDWGADFENEYYLQKPEDLVESGLGVCWDSAELEREWFSKHGYEAKVYFMWFKKEEDNDLPTHTFLVYKQGEKYYWFEHSASANRGIHEYDSLDALLAEAKSEHIDYAINERGASEDDVKDFVLLDFDKPEYNCSPEVFVEHIMSNDKTGV